MVNTHRKMFKRVLMMVIISFLFTSAAIIHAYAGGDGEDASAVPYAQSGDAAGSSPHGQLAGASTVILTIDVCPGDTLWDIAAANKPTNENIRSYIYKIKKMNHMKNSDIKAGDILMLP